MGILQRRKDPQQTVGQHVEGRLWLPLVHDLWVILGFRWNMGRLEGDGSTEEAGITGLGDAGRRVQWRGTGRGLVPQGFAQLPFHFQPTPPALCVTPSFLTLGEPTG